MNAKEFLKSKHVFHGLGVEEDNTTGRSHKISDLMEEYAKIYHEQQCAIHECAKLRKALETIRDAFYIDGETDKEKIDDLKAKASNVLYEIDNNIEVE